MHLRYLTMHNYVSPQQGEDLDEYSISEIAKCRLEHPKVAPSTKKKDEIFIASSHTKEAERVKNVSAKLFISIYHQNSA